MNDKWVTRSTGQQEVFQGGMVRDSQEGKPRFDLLVPLGIPYSDQMLTRWAGLMRRGGEKYGDRNWERSAGSEELSRAKASAFRHFAQWLCDETDEDHAAAILFNVTQVEYIKTRLRQESRPIGAK